MPLPTNRTVLDTVEEHLDDHNALNTQHNELEGHADATTGVHGIADTAALALSSHDHDADYEPIGAAAAAAAALVDAAPGTLDTLNELAAALGDDANFASTVTTSLAGKASTSHTHTGTYEPVATAHHARHEPGGGDAMAADAAAGTASLRSLGTSSTQAAAGNHAHTGTYVAVSDYDGKGELLVGSANDAYDNLAVSTDGYVLTLDSAQTLGVKWAAAGGSAVAVGRPKSATLTGITLPGVAFVTGAGTRVFTADTIYYHPILTPTAITLDRLTFESTVNVSSGAMRLGIYNADTDWQPTSLVIDAGTVSTTALGVKSITINQALPAGRYLLAMNQSNGNHTLRVVSGQVVGAAVFDAALGGNFVETLAKSSAYATFASTGVAWDTAATATNFHRYPIFCRVSTP